MIHPLQRDAILFSISNHFFSQSYINGTRGTEQATHTHTHTVCMPNFRIQELEFITKTDKFIVFCSLRDVYDFFIHTNFDYNSCKYINVLDNYYFQQIN